jgi:hypothetical protein
MHAAPVLPSKTRPKRAKAFTQILEMQDMLRRDALKPETPPRERAQVACAWERLEERKRILRMKPKLKDVDTTLAEKRKQANRPKVVFSLEPDEPPQDEVAEEEVAEE